MREISKGQSTLIREFCAWRGCPIPLLRTSDEAETWLNRIGRNDFYNFHRSRAEQKKQKEVHPLREKACQLIGAGLSDKEIRNVMHIATSTLRRYRMEMENRK